MVSDGILQILKTDHSGWQKFLFVTENVIIIWNQFHIILLVS